MDFESGPGKSLLRFLTEPAHVNYNGKVHGGMVMKWIDQAGYTCAAQWSGTYCVTVYVGGIHFIRPIMVGSTVDMRSQIIHTGRSSMHIFIDIFAGDPREGTMHRSSYCLAVFVALGPDGRPVAVPKWEPATEREHSLERYAHQLMRHREAMDLEAKEILGDES
jgi:uncharacterized protein (TIGR00369 family)